MTLLEKAKAIPGIKYRKYEGQTEEDIELALAWVNDEVTLTQVSKAHGLVGVNGSTYSRIALSLKKYIKQTQNQ
jgi:hypothetical protein